MQIYQPENNPYSNLMVDVTHRCNMECSNCYLPNRDIPDMDVNKLYESVDKLPRKTFIRLIGAEPTMRDDICDIISTLKRKGHHVSLTTNGVKLAHEPYVKKLKNTGLRLVLLSMNGADEDDVYKILDEGKWATAKTRALKNLMKHNMIINTGTIIAKGVNEHTIHRQINMFQEYMVETNYNPKIKPVLRFRTIGEIGRYMEDSTIEYNEFINIAANQLEVTADYIRNNNAKALNNTHGLIFEYKNMLIRLVDWSADEDGIPDSNSQYRGRFTEDFKVAPFFEHVKENEFGY